jgi:lipopolysaccharide transport system ATP-binding protein
MSNEKSAVLLELANVSHSYYPNKRSSDNTIHHVLNNVSLKLYEGETLGIVGRNGVGKTTTLRLMAGILAPNLGRVWIQPGRSASLLSLGLGFKPDLSGRDNAFLAAMLQGSSRKQAESFLDEIAEFSELGDYFYEPVKSYSAGMVARLSFTTALMTHVDVLLIDEILTVGDARFRGKAQAAMQNRITGEQTVVFVSHMADQVKSLCSRVIWLDKGSIVAEGNPAEIMRAYQDDVNEARKAGLIEYA